MRPLKKNYEPFIQNDWCSGFGGAKVVPGDRDTRFTSPKLKSESDYLIVVTRKIFFRIIILYQRKQYNTESLNYCRLS